MKKILVVDDEVDILEVVKIILTSHNFDVETITDWRLINETIDHFNPHIILLDVSLGGADGREICKQLNDIDDTKHIPVILFSAHYNLHNDLKGCEPNAIITKPFDGKNLVNVINEQLGLVEFGKN